MGAIYDRIVPIFIPFILSPCLSFIIWIIVTDVTVIAMIYFIDHRFFYPPTFFFFFFLRNTPERRTLAAIIGERSVII